MSEFINPNDYQKQADRTKCNQIDALDRLNECPHFIQVARMSLLHGIIGLIGELGELAGIVERWLWYGQDFDRENFIEELGDSQWYNAELHNALDVSMLEVMRANIRKLRSRYPEKFDQELAKEENRNREEEMKAALGPPRYLKEFEEQTGQGFAEPPEDGDDGLRDPETGDYKQCEFCSQYLDADGTCPEGCPENDSRMLSCGSTPEPSTVTERLFPDGPGYYRNNWGPGGEVVKLTDEELAKIPKAHQMSYQNDWGSDPGSSHAVKPLGFVTKEQIDKALEGQDSFAMKDFEGFPPALGSEEFYQSMGVPPEVFEGSLPRPVSNPVDPPYLYGKSRDARTGTNSVGKGVIEQLKQDPEPEDGWTVARKIANTFVEGSQNVSYAWKMIDQAEEQWKKELPRSTPPKDSEEKYRLEWCGRHALEALGLDPENSSPKDVEDQIYWLKVNAS